MSVVTPLKAEAAAQLMPFQLTVNASLALPSSILAAKSVTPMDARNVDQDLSWLLGSASLKETLVMPSCQD